MLCFKRYSYVTVMRVYCEHRVRDFTVKWVIAPRYLVCVGQAVAGGSDYVYEKQ